jgi:hypothetical protein
MATFPSVTDHEASMLQPLAEIPGLRPATPNGNIESLLATQLVQDDATNQQFLGSPHVVVLPNAFPQYADGDVLIISGAGQTWRLHSSYLIKYSKVFASLLDPNKASHVTRKQRDAGMTIRWKLEVVEFRDNPTDCRLRSFKLVVSAHSR